MHIGMFFQLFVVFWYVGTYVTVALKCLSCDDVIQPRHCTFMKTCQAGDACEVQKYDHGNGRFLYRMGCATRQSCRTRRSEVGTGAVKRQAVSLVCTECCDGDFCNSKGCGEPGWPVERGPVCYTCSQTNLVENCNEISVCKQSEYCQIQEIQEFGDTFYKTQCQPKFVCDIEGGVAPAIGKRDSRQIVCSTCCHTDLCNNQCKHSNPTPVCEDIADDCDYYKRYHGICENAVVANRMGCDKTCHFCNDSAQTTTSTVQSATVKPSEATTDKEHTGHEYFIMFTPNYPSSVYHLEVIIISDRASNLTVESNLNYHPQKQLPAGDSHFVLPATVILAENKITTKGIIFKTGSDVTITAINKVKASSSEGYSVIPTDQLGTSYVTGGFVQYKSYMSHVAVGAVYDNTEVELTISTTANITFNGSLYHDDDVIRTTLNRLDTLLISGAGDLSGTKVNSNKPVAVISGNVCAYVPYVVQSCNHLTEYITPTSKLGTEFLVPPTIYEKKGIVKIIPTTRNYTVKVYSGETLQTTVYNRYNTSGGIIQFPTNSLSPYYIQSSTPALVLQFSVYEREKAPFMTQVPSFNQFTNHASLAAPSESATYTNYATVTIETSAVNGLLVNSSVITTTAQPPTTLRITRSGYTVDFSFINLPVSDKGVTTISHSDSNVRFGVLAYGLKFEEAYAFPAG